MWESKAVFGSWIWWGKKKWNEKVRQSNHLELLDYLPFRFQFPYPSPNPGSNYSLSLYPTARNNIAFVTSRCKIFLHVLERLLIASPSSFVALVRVLFIHSYCHADFGWPKNSVMQHVSHLQSKNILRTPLAKYYPFRIVKKKSVENWFEVVDSWS